MTQSGRLGHGAVMWSRWSLRTRILLAVLAWTAVGVGGIWYSATRLFIKHVELLYHEELDVHIRELAGLVSTGADGKLRMDRPLSDPRYLVPLSGFYWQVTDASGQSLRSPSMTQGKLDESVAHDSSIHHHVQDGPTGPTITYGIMRRAPSGSEIHFVIATDQRLLDATIISFTRELTVWLSLLAAALLVTGWALVSMGLLPLRRLALATARLRGGHVRRLEGKYPSEIAPLVGDLNDFIDHNGRVVERARVEAGNLAHALRTPLAIITDEAERLAASPETRDASQVLLNQGEAMVQQIEYQLARARTVAGARGPGTACRLLEVLPPILSAMRRLHPERTFTTHMPDEADLIVPVDAMDLSEIVSILLDNAGKWSRQKVDLWVESASSGLQVRIVDDGPGMPPEHVATAFEIGTRFDRSTRGYGLGLAIARDIAAVYGIGIELTGRRDGRSGLEATLALPCMPEPLEG